MTDQFSPPADVAGSAALPGDSGSAAAGAVPHGGAAAPAISRIPPPDFMPGARPSKRREAYRAARAAMAVPTDPDIADDQALADEIDAATLRTVNHPARQWASRHQPPEGAA